MLFLTKSKDHKSNVPYQWIHRQHFYGWKFNFRCPSKAFVSRISLWNTLYDANYPQKSSLDNHFQSVHEGKRPLEYDICNASFAQKRNLKSYILSVHEGEKTSSSRL